MLQIINVKLLGQVKVDEFAFILLGAIIFIAILMVTWTTPTELPPEAHPSSFLLHAQPNKTYKLVLNISGKITNVQLQANGTIAKWISFSKNNFDIPSDFSLVDVIVAVPNVSPGEYSGYIIIRSTGGEKAVPVQIFVEEKVRILSRTMPIEDFLISNFGNKKILDYKENFDVYTSYFYKDKLKLIGRIDSNINDVTKAYVVLVIDDKNDYGNLIVKLNEKEIYNKKAPLGETIIPINVSDLTSMNIISVEASSPGLRFWSSTKYHVALAQLVVEFKQAEKTFNFSLDESEIQNFYSFGLTSLLEPSLPVPTLGIKINNQLVYLGKPPLAVFNVTFSKDLLGRSLLLGASNTISFYLESEGTLKFSNVLFTINTLA